MSLLGYEGPRDGDYVTYVDELMRASPEFRRTQRSIAGAIEDAVVTPGGQAGSPLSQLRNTLQKARDMAEQAQRAQSGSTAAHAAGRKAGSPATAPQRPLTKADAKQRLRAMEREIESKKNQKGSKPWLSPGSLALIVGGVVMSQFVQGFGAILIIMGAMSLLGGVLRRFQGK